MGSVYALLDPQTGLLRYVGKCKGRIERRIYGHVYNANRGPRNRKSNWILGLLRDGLRPEIFELESVEIAALNDAEIAWIGGLRLAGAELLNETGGGDGGSTFHGRRHTEETKRKMREAQKRRPPASRETRAKMAAAKRGRRLPAETRRKMSAAKKGMKRDPASVEKGAEKLRGRPFSLSHRINIGRGRGGTGVAACHLKTGEILTFENVTEAARALKLTRQSVSKVVRGELSRTGAYTFKPL